MLSLVCANLFYIFAFVVDRIDCKMRLRRLCAKEYENDTK